jgi:hypothetical protein
MLARRLDRFNERQINVRRLLLCPEPIVTVSTDNCSKSTPNVAPYLENFEKCEMDI